MSIIGYELTNMNNLRPQTFLRGPVRANTNNISNVSISGEIFIISIFIFVTIFSWFEFIRIFYDAVFLIETDESYKIAYARLVYAIFVTVLSSILSLIVYGIVNWSPSIFNN